MDKELLLQRLRKYPDAIAVIKEVGEVSYIDWQGVRLSNTKYGPLWTLFTRYRDDKILERDIKYIEILEDLLEEVNYEHIKDLYNYVQNKLSNKATARVTIERKLFKEHTSLVRGYVHEIRQDSFMLYDNGGKLRAVKFEDIVSYKL